MRQGVNKCTNPRSDVDPSSTFLGNDTPSFNYIDDDYANGVPVYSMD